MTLGKADMPLHSTSSLYVCSQHGGVRLTAVRADGLKLTTGMFLLLLLQWKNKHERVRQALHFTVEGL